MELSTAISTLESAIGDPRRGLPLEVFHFSTRILPLINVDLLIQDDTGRTLLTWRDDEIFGAGWHVPGGIIRYKEPIADRIRACALEELGAEVSFDAAPLLVTESIREPDIAISSRGHFISLLFRCRLLNSLDESRRADPNAPARGAWHWHRGCPPDLLQVQSYYARFFG